MRQQAIYGDTKGQGSSEIAAPGALYAVDFLRRQSKNPLGASACAARGQTAPGKIDAKNEDDEDEKLSTKPGQLHFFGFHSIFAILEPSGNGLPLPGMPAR